MDKIDDIIVIMGKGRDSNTYIIDDVMIDPGSGENIEYLKEEIKSAGLEMTDIKKIVKTHCHFDHMGADKHLQDEYGYEVYMHPLDLKSVQEKDAQTTVAAEIRELNEGDKVGNYEVIHTPGHTRGGICLFDGKSLISGDTIFSGGNFGRTDLPTGNLQEMKESILRIADLDAVQLFSGHGPYAITRVSEQISLAVMIASRL